MNTHFGLVHCAHIEFSRWPSEKMRVLQNMPINHIANIGMMSSYALVAGGTLIFMDCFDAGEILKVIETEKITFWLQAPAMFHLVINHPEFNRSDLSSLEYIVWGGGPMPEHMVRFLSTLGAKLAMAYGMTELTAYASYSDANASHEVLANTIGRPEPRYDLRLMKADGRIAEIGEPGEIQAKGRWLMNGYFNEPEATAESFTADGWFKTGDIAQLRSDGNWHLVGRTKEMYKSGGFNIYPREIEIVIEEHPGVAMTAVLATFDPIYNEVGYAFVQLQENADVDEAELKHWCRERLANYKVPKNFEIINELPKLPIGKIDKQSLKHKLEKARASSS
ncbi:MAG: AMP-binding protein [Gammaproteobacteria bacterium]|nr:AMP-binding protein [Gammaproteobacteria bacterium]